MLLFGSILMFFFVLCWKLFLLFSFELFLQFFCYKAAFENDVIRNFDCRNKWNDQGFNRSSTKWPHLTSFRNTVFKCFSPKLLWHFIVWPCDEWLIEMFPLLLLWKKIAGGFKANVISIYYFKEILSAEFLSQMLYNLSCKKKSTIISLLQTAVTAIKTFKLHRISQQNEVKGKQETYN